VSELKEVPLYRLLNVLEELAWGEHWSTSESRGLRNQSAAVSQLFKHWLAFVRVPKLIDLLTSLTFCPNKESLKRAGPNLAAINCWLAGNHSDIIRSAESESKTH